MPRTIYWIGGSPCCGKSAVAEHLAKKHGLFLYSLDEDLGDFMSRLAGQGNLLCRDMLKPWNDATWERDVQTLCREQELLYELVFPLMWEKLSALPHPVVVAEGAGLMPSLVNGYGVPAQRYLCMVPTPSFQWEQYARRDWVELFLKDCTRPQFAFRRWMERDELFARRRLEEAKALGYPTLLVDGTLSLEQTLARAEKAFGLAG